jgi:hypothetical protein
MLSYAEALKQLSAQKDIFEQRVTDYEQKVAGHEAKLEDLAGQLDIKGARGGPGSGRIAIAA